MKIYAKLVLMVLTLGYYSTVFSSDATVVLPEELMGASGIEQQVTNLSKILQDINQSMSGILCIKKRYVDHRYDINQLDIVSTLKKLNEEILKNIKLEEYNYLMAWYKSDLGDNISLKEMSSQTKGNLQYVVSHRQTIIADQKSRMVDFENLLQSIRDKKKTNELILFAPQLLLSSLQSKFNLSNADVNALLDHSFLQNPKLQLARNILMSFLIFTYQDLTKEQMEQYVGFISSETFSHFQRVVSQLLKNEMNHVHDEISIKQVKISGQKRQYIKLPENVSIYLIQRVNYYRL